MTAHDLERQRSNMRSKKTVKIILQLFLSVVVLGCSFALATYYLKTSPKAKPIKRNPRPPLVQVADITFGTERYLIESMGTVIGAEEVNLTPRVSGEVISIAGDFIPGGIFNQGAILLQIDPADYKLHIRQLRSEVAKAENDLSLEMGNQRIAQKEFEILGQKVSETEKKLMLRMPQLGIAKANLDGVRAQLHQAELNLARTRLNAPFNGVIQEKKVSIGSRVSPTTSVAKIVGTDRFWVRLTVPIDQLRWINIPSNSNDKGSEIRIYPQMKGGVTISRLGHLIRLSAELEQDGRMAQLYGAVDDPLCLLPENKDQPRLLLGSFVQAEITGQEFTEVAVIPREQLRPDDRVWLLDHKGRLVIRPVVVAARTKEKIFISSGLAPGEKIIVSALSNPVEGTVLKVLSTPTDERDKLVEEKR